MRRMSAFVSFVSRIASTSCSSANVSTTRSSSSRRSVPRATRRSTERRTAGAVKSTERSSQKRSQKSAARAGVGELSFLGHAHAQGDRRKRDRDATSSGRGEVVEVREQIGQAGAADLREALLAELGVVVLEDDVRDAVVDPGPHVVRVGVEKARQVEEPRAPELVRTEAEPHVARGTSAVGRRVGQERRQQKNDEAHPEERGDRPNRAPQGVAEHSEPTIQIVWPC